MDCDANGFQVQFFVERSQPQAQIHSRPHHSFAAMLITIVASLQVDVEVTGE